MELGRMFSPPRPFSTRALRELAARESFPLPLRKIPVVGWCIWRHDLEEWVRQVMSEE